MDTLVGLVERDVAELGRAPAPQQPADIEKRMKVYRAAALAGRGVLDLAAAVDRALRAADDGDEADDGEVDDEDGEGLGPDELEALRREAERRYSRFDRRPGGPPGGHPGAAGAGLAAGGAGLGGAGP